jgi:hypothetical protein
MNKSKITICIILVVIFTVFGMIFIAIDSSHNSTITINDRFNIKYVQRLDGPTTGIRDIFIIKDKKSKNGAEYIAITGIGISKLEVNKE